MHTIQKKQNLDLGSELAEEKVHLLHGLPVQFNSVQSLSRVRLFATQWIKACQASLSITNSQSSLRLTHPSSQWCHPAISSSVVPFSSCPQSLPASESFPMSQLFAWGGQSTGVSALASYLPKKSQGWSPCSPRDYYISVIPQWTCFLKMYLCWYAAMYDPTWRQSQAERPGGGTLGPH